MVTPPSTTTHPSTTFHSPANDHERTHYFVPRPHIQENIPRSDPAPSVRPYDRHTETSPHRDATRYSSKTTARATPQPPYLSSHARLLLLR